MIALLALTAWAAAPDTPPDRATLVLLRSLSYDRHLAAEPGPLRIGVVRSSPDDAVAIGVEATVRGLSGVTVAGRPIAAPTTLSAEGDWAGRLAGLDVVIVVPGADPALAGLVLVAREGDVLLLTLDPGFVGRGAALGVAVEGSRLQLLVDRAAAVDQGSDFSSELLELARAVKP